MMSSLLEEIVTEIKLNNPDASADEVSKAVLRFIQQDALPEALRKMRMPEPISPLQRWRERERLKRVKKKRREALRIRMQESEELFLEFEYVKHQLVKTDIDASSFGPGLLYGGVANPLARRTISVGTIPTMDKLFLKKDGISFIEHEEARKRRDELSKMWLYSPIPKEKGEEPIVFQIDELVQSKIWSDPFFAENLGVIEKVARTFAAGSPFKMDFLVSFRTDIEIPKWQKMILSVRVVDLDFDRIMKLWDEFDGKIRKEIQQRIGVASGLEKEKLEEMNRTFFTSFKLA